LALPDAIGEQDQRHRPSINSTAISITIGIRRLRDTFLASSAPQYEPGTGRRADLFGITPPSF
jgi:hypothetical protein